MIAENQGASASVEDGVVAGVVVVVALVPVLELLVFVVVAGGSVGMAFLDCPDGIFVPGR